MPEPLDIAAMERDLAQAGVSVAELCRRAAIAQSTWNRWKNGATSAPRGRSRRDVTAAFHALLSEQEAERPIPPSPVEAAA